MQPPPAPPPVLPTAPIHDPWEIGFEIIGVNGMALRMSQKVGGGLFDSIGLRLGGAGGWIVDPHWADRRHDRVYHDDAYYAYDEDFYEDDDYDYDGSGNFAEGAMFAVATLDLFPRGRWQLELQGGGAVLTWDPDQPGYVPRRGPALRAPGRPVRHELRHHGVQGRLRRSHHGGPGRLAFVDVVTFSSARADTR